MFDDTRCVQMHPREATEINEHIHTYIHTHTHTNTHTHTHTHLFLVIDERGLDHLQHIQVIINLDVGDLVHVVRQQHLSLE